MSSPPFSVDLTRETSVFFTSPTQPLNLQHRKKSFKEEYFKMSGMEQRRMEAYSSER
jgi:hypothetical protein